MGTPGIQHLDYFDSVSTHVVVPIVNNVFEPKDPTAAVSIVLDPQHFPASPDLRDHASTLLMMMTTTTTTTKTWGSGQELGGSQVYLPFPVILSADLVVTQHLGWFQTVLYLARPVGRTATLLWGVALSLSLSGLVLVAASHLLARRLRRSDRRTLTQLLHQAWESIVAYADGELEQRRAQHQGYQEDEPPSPEYGGNRATGFTAPPTSGSTSAVVSESNSVTAAAAAEAENMRVKKMKKMMTPLEGGDLKTMKNVGTYSTAVVRPAVVSSSSLVQRRARAASSPMADVHGGEGKRGREGDDGGGGGDDEEEEPFPSPGVAAHSSWVDVGTTTPSRSSLDTSGDQ